MGIKDFSKVFGASSVKFANKDFKDKRIGLDASCEIYRATLGAMNGLSSGKGESTIIYNVILQNIVKYKKLGVKGIIYVFDHPEPNPLKAAENKKRREIRKKLAARAKSKDCKDKLSFKLTGELVRNIQHMLDLMGVAWIVAPKGFEAEHLGARLTQVGLINLFITGDSDTLLFGAKNVVVKVRKAGKTELRKYNLATLLDKFGLTMEEFVHLGVVMGTDFAAKTPRIGPKTIFKKGPSAVLTEEQKTAKKYFESVCPFKIEHIVKKKINKDSLIDWLVEKDFNRERLEKILANY